MNIDLQPLSLQLGSGVVRRNVTHQRWACPSASWPEGRNRDYDEKHNRGCHRLAAEWKGNMKCAQYCKAVSVGLLLQSDVAWDDRGLTNCHGEHFPHVS